MNKFTNNIMDDWNLNEIHAKIVETKLVSFAYEQFYNELLSLEESLSITTGRCNLAIGTHARKMHEKNLCGCPPGGFG